MEEERTTHEYVVNEFKFDFDYSLLKSGITGITYNKNDEKLKKLHKGDYIWMIKENDLEERMLIEVTDIREIPNNAYRTNPQLPKNIENSPHKDFIEWFVKEYMTIKSFILVEYALIQDLTKSDETRKLSK